MEFEEDEIESLFTRDLREILCVDRFIGDEKCRRLCDRITDPSSSCYNQVKRIALRGNCINIQGAQAIAGVLLAGVELNSISIEWNQLGTPGAIFIAEALPDNTTLAHLDLRNNGIGDDGACALAAAVDKNATLVVLDLRWNQISDRGALAFEAVLKNRTKKKITVLLGGNLISSSILSRIDDWNKTEPAPRPPVKEPAPQPVINFNAINEEINKELQQLRLECASLRERGDDLDRQLNASALRITELEHNLMREQFKTSQLEDALKNARLKVAELTTEKKGLVDSWDRERDSMLDDFRRQLDEKDIEISALLAEQELFKSRIRKATDIASNLEAQLDRTNKQYLEERSRLMEELRLMQARCTELSIQESKLRSENQSLNAASGRAADRIYSLETELKDSKIQIMTVLKEQEIKHVTETDAIREQFRQSSAASMAMIGRQAQELTSLRNKLSEVEATNASMGLEMQKRCDEVAGAARLEEQKRSNATISDLRQRLEIISASRNELENRNALNLSELMELKNKHNKALTDFQELLSSMQMETQDLRSMNSSLRDIVLTAENENKHNAAEINSLQKRINTSEQRSEKLQFELSKSTAEVQRLQTENTKLESQLEDMKNRRSIEFSKLRSRIEGSLGRELDSLTLDLGLDVLPANN